MSDETPKDAEVEETPEPEAAASDELEPTAADEAAADAAAEEEEDDVLTDEPEAEADEEPEAEADDEPRRPEAEEAAPAAEEKPKPPPALARQEGRGGSRPRAPSPPASASRRVSASLVRAQAKYVRTSARKARLVCDHIRGKSVLEARAILALTPRHVARDWSKLLESAVANAENNHELIGDELRIASVTADEGPTLKRFRPRAMGRATRIRKRTSHLTILLTPKES